MPGRAEAIQEGSLVRQGPLREQILYALGWPGLDWLVAGRQSLAASWLKPWMLGFDGGAVVVKNLFDSTVVTQIKARLAQLEPQSERQWGKMTAAQMLAHCSMSMQWAVGEVVPETAALPAQMMGRLVKPLVFRNEDPMRRNSPTVKSLLVTDACDLNKERTALLSLIDRFAAGGPAGCTRSPHSFFGRMKPEEWAILMYKHLDHHLRQFGV